MKILRCNDITGEPCDYIAEGDAPEYIKEDLMQHINDEHGALWRATPPSEKIKIDELIDETLENAEDGVSYE